MAMPYTLKFEVAFDTDPADEPGALDWTDLSTRLRTDPPISVATGAGRLEGGDEGDLTLTLDNEDRLIDPTNSDATLNLIPMRHARLTETISGEGVFRGFVDEWPPAWGFTGTTVQVGLVDGLAWLGLQDGDVDLPAQESHERITALLDLAGWPAGLRDIGTGRVRVEAYEQDGANLLRVLEDTVDAEQGDLYVAPDGKITFRGRHHRLNQTASIIFGGGTTVGIAAADPQYDTVRLSNIGRVELEDGRVFEAVDSTSQTKYGPRSSSIRDLPLTQPESIALAEWETVRFATQRLWIDGLECHGHETGVLAAVLPLRVGDLAQVLYAPRQGAAFDRNLSIERIAHEIGDDGWHVFVDLSPYFGDGPWFEWDNPAKGWDSGALWAP
jgi:hypothetical protein